MLSRFLRPLEPIAYGLLRVGAGVMFAFHGIQKLFGLYGGHIPNTFSQVWFGGVIELVSGVLIALGLYASCAAFVASGTMAVAYVQFHWKGELGSQFLPIVNKGEMAALYALIFFFIACRDSCRGKGGRQNG